MMDVHFKGITAIVAVAAVTLIGDFFLKLASNEERIFHNAWFAFGCLIYALGAVGWVWAMRHVPLGILGAVYAVATALLLTCMGAWMFDENLGQREIAGILLGVTSVTLLLVD